MARAGGGGGAITSREQTPHQPCPHHAEGVAWGGVVVGQEEVELGARVKVNLPWKFFHHPNKYVPVPVTLSCHVVPLQCVVNTQFEPIGVDIPLVLCAEQHVS